MNKPLKDMTVGELRSYAYLAGEVNKDLGHAHPLRWLARQAFDELARRLAEAERRLDRYTRISESGLSLGDHLDCIEQIERVKPVVDALRPFTHPDLCKELGGNSEGDNSPVYGRDAALLRLGHFRDAAKAMRGYEKEK